MRESTDDVPEISPPPVQWEGRVSWVVEVVVVVDELLRRVLQKLINNSYENKNCNTGLEKNPNCLTFFIFSYPSIVFKAAVKIGMKKKHLHTQGFPLTTL